MKTSSLRGPSVSLLIVLSPALARAGLTVDLNAGSLNALQIGRPADAKAVAAALGTEPGRIDEDFPSVKGYLFPDKGVEVETIDDGEVVHDIAVYYTAGTDFYDVPVRRYPGDFVPALGAGETVD
ncbi:MAG: hypothetical protein HYV15_04340, partial [Elusimicrobia bacterium]|nr:hypothetical protein [Elusimicrobiota bacterium]